MIQIGVNENVYLADASIDDKAVIKIIFKEADKVKGETKSLFAMAASSEVEEVDSGKTIMLFPPNGPKEDSLLSPEKKAERAVDDINKVKGICLHLLKGYYTAEELKDKMVPFAGTTLTEENFNTEVLKKEVLEVVQRNIARVFLEMIKPHLNDPAKAFRLLLIRQSADKHFPTLRARFLDDNPFWESMKIPLDASAVKFTAWEIDNGYNSGAPSAKASKPGEAAGEATAAPATAASIFSGQG